MTTIAPVWCASCKVAWAQAIVETINAAINPQASPVRCPYCSCHRRVRRVPEEISFREQHPEVHWIR